MDGWLGLDDGVYVRAEPEYRVNAGLVVGNRRALVIDTGTGPRQGGRILAAVRTATSLPLIVVNTHAHFDHFYGNAVFAAAGVTEFWAHRGAVHRMVLGGDDRATVADIEPEMAAGRGPDTALIVPTNTIDHEAVELDLGGRSVRLCHLGPAHTDGDLLVHAASVTFAGDLVEEGADPAFEDADPDGWVRALRALAAAEPDVVVPGHGRPVDAQYVSAAADTMEEALRVARRDRKDTPMNPGTLASTLPYGIEQSLALIGRL